MKSVGYILWGSAIASLIFAAFKSSMIWIATPLLVLALSYSSLRLFLYRPPEDHLGVIYRFDRLWRLVGPDEWIGVIPWANEIKPPISLHLRRVEVSLSNILTQDQVPIDCELLVYYQLDLRLASAHFRPQALRISEESWNSIIGTVLRETVSELIGGTIFQQLLTLGGHGRLKRTLSALLAERVRGWGLKVNPQTGVSVQVLKPANAIWQAMLDRLAANPVGEAALARVRPMLEDLSQRHPEVAGDALLLELAAAVTKGVVPRAVIAPGGGSTHEGYAQGMLLATLQTALQGRDEQEPTGRSETRATAQDHDGEHRVKIAGSGTD